MSDNKLLLVSFKPISASYVAYVPLNQFLASNKDFETVLVQVTKVYQNSITLMKKTLVEIENCRSIRKPLPARLVWKLGDLIFQLTADLEAKGFQIDGVYEHLVRELEVKRKWLEKVIILRRYILKQNMIPKALNWGYYEKGTRKKAEGTSKNIITG